MRFAQTKKVHLPDAWGQYQVARDLWQRTAIKVFIRLHTDPVPEGYDNPPAIESHPEAGRHAIELDRFPTTPGEAMLELESLMLWVLEVLFKVVPLCQVCWRLHPESESEDRHSERWMVPPVERDMRKRWHQNAGVQGREERLQGVKKALLSEGLNALFECEPGTDIDLEPFFTQEFYRQTPSNSASRSQHPNPFPSWSTFLAVIRGDHVRHGSPIGTPQTASQVSSIIPSALATEDDDLDLDIGMELLQLKQEAEAEVDRLEVERDASRAEVERLRRLLEDGADKTQQLEAGVERSEIELKRRKGELDDLKSRVGEGNGRIAGLQAELRRQTRFTKELSGLKEESEGAYLSEADRSTGLRKRLERQRETELKLRTTLNELLGLKEETELAYDGAVDRSTELTIELEDRSRAQHQTEVDLCRARDRSDDQGRALVELLGPKEETESAYWVEAGRSAELTVELQHGSVQQRDIRVELDRDEAESAYDAEAHKVNELDVELDDQKRATRDCQTMADAQARRVAGRDQAIKELSMLKDESEGVVDTHSRRISDMNVRIEGLEQDLRTRDGQLEKADEDAKARHELQTQLVDLRAERDKVVAERDERAMANFRLKGGAKRRNNEIEDLRSALRDRCELSDCLREEIVRLRPLATEHPQLRIVAVTQANRIARGEKEQVRLLQRVDELNGRVAPLRQELVDRENGTARIRGLLVTSKRDVRMLEGKLKTSEQRENRLEIEVRELKQNVRTKQARVAALEGEVSRLRDEVVAHEATIVDKDAAIETLKRRADRVEVLLKQQADRADALEVDNRLLQCQIEVDLPELAASRDEREARVEALENELEQLRAAMTIKNQTIFDAEVRMRGLEIELGALEAIRDGNGERGRLEETIREGAVERGRLEERNKFVRNLASATQKLLDAEKQKLMASEQKVGEAKSRGDGLQFRVDELQRQVGALAGQREDLDRKVAAAEQKTREEKSRGDGLQSKVDESQRQVEALAEQQQNLRRQVEAFQEQELGLQRQVQTTEADRSLQEQVRTAEQQIVTERQRVRTMEERIEIERKRVDKAEEKERAAITKSGELEVWAKSEKARGGSEKTRADGEKARADGLVRGMAILDNVVDVEPPPANYRIEVVEDRVLGELGSVPQDRVKLLEAIVLVTRHRHRLRPAVSRKRAGQYMKLAINTVEQWEVQHPDEAGPLIR